MAKKITEALRAVRVRAVAVFAALVLLATKPLAIWALRTFLSEYPIMGFAFAAAVLAVATTPLAFAVLGRLDWFQARRGRTYQRPEFWSICCGMALVMAIPAIFAALVIQSRHFDKNRYEFDPNKTWSVLEQGRGYDSVLAADKAVLRKEEEIDDVRKQLVNSVKKLDEAMLVLRAAAGSSPTVARSLPDVLERLAAVRKPLGVDGPQQLQDFTAPPADIKGATVAANTSPIPARVADIPAAAPVAESPAAAAGSLPKIVADAEIASVPASQKPIAEMLPLTDLPAGWTVGKSGTKHLETFNAENLFEKIDGRAESFIQYDVKGMAYTYFHPVGDESNEIQLYIFEMANPLKALGKYGSEKPGEGIAASPVGTEGYSSAGSIHFHAALLHSGRLDQR